MKASIELSLYPLSSDYKNKITDFIKKLRKQQGIEVLTNGMSTQIFGDFEVLMDILKVELKEVLEHHRSVAVLKITDGILTPDQLPEELK